MYLKNTHAIIILSICVGIATDLGLIGAQSYFLSFAEAVYTIYGSVFAYLLFTFFLRNFPLIKLKFCHFAALAILVFILLLAAISQDWITGLPKAAVWYLTSMFGFAFLRWIVSEFTVRYLDPVRAQSYFSYLSAFFEGGTVLVILALKLNGRVLDVGQTLCAIIGCCLACLAVIVYQFFPAKNRESAHAKAKAHVSSKLATHLKPLITSFLLMSVAFALVEVCEDYLVKTVVKHTLKNYFDIRAMTDNYFAASCTMVVLFSLIMGKAIESKRISPIKLFNSYAALMAGLGVVCLVTHQFYVFILFEVTRRTCEYCLYRPANQMVLSAFVGDLRPKITAMHSYCYYVIVRTTMAVVFTFTRTLAYEVQTTLVLGLILIAAACAATGLFKFRTLFVSTLYEFVNSGNKTAAVIAAHILSYLRPRDFVDKMTQVLANTPKNILTKTIVLGMGYSPGQDSVAVIESQFQTEKEEIQIAVLDALRISGNFKAIQFLLNVLMERARPKTQRVRLNAMAMIGGIYGKKAIPFLLNGLEHKDNRVVANTLDILSSFRERSLKPYFLKFALSEIPRVKANALLGLSFFPETRSYYRESVKKALTDESVPMLASVLYGIGRLKDSYFRQDLLRIYDKPALRHHPAIINVLSWSLVRLNERKGFELACEIMQLPEESAAHTGFMHFFSLSGQETRYDILKLFIATNGGSESETVKRIGDRLKKSPYDFNDELEFLGIA